MSLSLDDLTPPTLVGWFEGLQSGRPLDDPGGPDSVRLKVVVGPEGIRFVALAEDRDRARILLEQLGFRSDQIRRMLCG